MGTVLAKDIVERIRTELIDEVADSQSWSDEELLSYVNDAQRAIVRHRPEENAHIEKIDVTGDGHKINLRNKISQSVLRPLDVNAQYKDGSISGSVPFTEMPDLDRMDPEWRTRSAGRIREYTIDWRNTSMLFLNWEKPAPPECENITSDDYWTSSSFEYDGDFERWERVDLTNASLEARDNVWAYDIYRPDHLSLSIEISNMDGSGETVSFTIDVIDSDGNTIGSYDEDEQEMGILDVQIDLAFQGSGIDRIAFSSTWYPDVVITKIEGCGDNLVGEML